MKQRTLITAQVCFVAPSLYFAHGMLHIQNLAGPAMLLVYAIKLSYLCIVFDSMIRFGLKPYNTKYRNIFVLAMPILISGSCAAVFYNRYINPFYFAADFIGLLIVPVYVLTLLYYLNRTTDGATEALRLTRLNLIVMSIYLLAYYILSGGAKVSTPPDTQLALAIAICAAVLGIKQANKKLQLAIFFAIATTIALSQLRMLMIVAALALSLSFARVLFLRFSATRIVKITSRILILIVCVFIFAGDIVEERIKTLPFIGDESTQVSEGIGDESTNQRLVESIQVFDQMNKNWPTYLIGTGFGAQYENKLVLNDHYSPLQHHLHSSPVAVLFRTGLIGLLVYFAIAAIAVRLVFSKSDIRFIAGAALLLQWISSLFDLYIFWGFSFSLGIAFALYTLTNPNEKPNR